MRRSAVRVGKVAIPVALAVLAAAWLVSSYGQQAENLKLTPQQWREDLHFLAHELPKRHANAFHYTSREKFEGAVADLDGRLDQLDSDQSWVGLARITALVGDAHTYLKSPRDDASFPLAVAKFGDDYRVAGVGPGLEKALGARIVKVQDTPVARAAELLYQLFSQDENPTLSENFIAGGLTTGSELRGVGILPDRTTARYTLADDDGKEFTLEVHALSPEESSKLSWTWAFRERPLYRQRPGERFWCQYLAEARTVYCNVRAIRDLGGLERAMLQMVKEQQPDKLVIDLRQNGGGDYNEGLKHLVHPIRDFPSINRKGHLFVLVGPFTFSAAMSNAAHFRYQTAALLVGQTIGEKPNSYQEPREMTLPNSHLTVRYSTKFYQFVESGENIIRPDQEILTTWEDYKAGRDPVLEWVLNYHPGR